MDYLVSVFIDNKSKDYVFHLIESIKANYKNIDFIFFTYDIEFCYKNKDKLDIILISEELSKDILYIIDLTSKFISSKNLDHYKMVFISNRLSFPLKGFPNLSKGNIILTKNIFLGSPIAIQLIFSDLEKKNDMISEVKNNIKLMKMQILNNERGFIFCS